MGKHYDVDTGHLDIVSAAKEIVDRFGFERTMYVLANTVWEYARDSSISLSSKEWARTIPCYDEPDISRGYIVSVAPDVIDRLIGQVRHDYSLAQPSKNHAFYSPSSPKEWTGMSDEALHMALLEKMQEEQGVFRAQLLEQTPEDILKHAFEYSAREDILSLMQWRSLDKPSYMALLASPAPLAALCAHYHRDAGREEFLRECIDQKIEFMVEDHEDLTQGQTETRAEKSGQHRRSVRDRLAVPSVPGQKSAGREKKEEER